MITMIRQDWAKQLKQGDPKDKVRAANMVAWGLTIVVVLVALYLVLGWSGAGACSDIIARKCVP
jgi:hypothetical protein